MTVIGTVGAILFPMDDITDFLYLIGSVFAPMIAIQIVNFFMLKKDCFGKDFDVPNLLVWLVGFAVYRYLMGVDIVLGNTLPDMLITGVLCWLVNKAVGKKA